MSRLENQWIDAFRVGNYGAKGTFTGDDLDYVVASYKPELHEAPVTIGHPQANLPAYGWVAKLRRLGDLLQFKATQVDPAFAEMVEAGKFKQRSASFYIDKDTGKRTLRHIGFLGAQPPEVKGLKAIQFEEGMETTEVGFEEEPMAEDAGLVDKIVAKFEERFGKKTGEAAVTFSEDQVKKIAEQAATAAVAEAVKPLQAKLDAQAVQFTEGRTAAATSARKTRAADAVAQLKLSGKWVPAFERKGLTVIFDELAKSTDTVEFGEGSVKKPTHPIDILVEFMEALPAIIPTSAIYTGQHLVSRQAKGVNPGRGGVDDASVRLHDAAVAFSEEHKVDYTVAIRSVLDKNPELGAVGGAAVGAA